MLEISYPAVPLHPRLPGLVEHLALAVDGLAAAPGAVVAVDRGDFGYVWTEHDHEMIDSKTGERRLACSRVLIAANDALQTLVTFSYWPADAGWAVPAWETIVSTLRLAGRTPETHGADGGRERARAQQIARATRGGVFPGPGRTGTSPRQGGSIYRRLDATRAPARRQLRPWSRKDAISMP